jgi:hypothetical protein
LEDNLLRGQLVDELLHVARIREEVVRADEQSNFRDELLELVGGRIGLAVVLVVALAVSVVVHLELFALDSLQPVIHVHGGSSCRGVGDVDLETRVVEVLRWSADCSQDDVANFRSQATDGRSNLIKRTVRKEFINPLTHEALNQLRMSEQHELLGLDVVHVRHRSQGYEQVKL